MMKFISVIALAGAICIATPACAEGIGGGRVEILTGYDNVSLDLEEFDLGSHNKNGIAFALAAGYDYAVSSNVALGLDLEVSDATTKYVYDATPDYAKITVDGELYIGARMSVAVSDTLNLYVKAGYTNASLKVNYTDGVDILSGATSGDGVRVGVGSQLDLSSNLFASMEYRYSNYESNFSRSQVLVGLGLRF